MNDSDMFFLLSEIEKKNENRRGVDPSRIYLELNHFNWVLCF